ncbi:hypothetical protein FQN60_000427, partial [Etheostoma spectabile]
MEHGRGWGEEKSQPLVSFLPKKIRNCHANTTHNDFCHISSSSFIIHSLRLLPHFNPTLKTAVLRKRVPMDYLRKYLWLWVIIVVIFACGMISIIFIFINRCISRRGINTGDIIGDSCLHKENTESHSFKEDLLTLLTKQKAWSLAEVPECRTCLTTKRHHDYEEAVPVTSRQARLQQAMPDYEQDK